MCSAPIYAYAPHYTYTVTVFIRLYALLERNMLRNFSNLSKLNCVYTHTYIYVARYGRYKIKNVI